MRISGVGRVITLYERKVVNVVLVDEAHSAGSSRVEKRGGESG